MKYLSIFLLVTLMLSSCKSPEARRPVSQQSGSYIDESVARNRKVVAKEEAQIREIMEKDTTRNFISSPNGFWYTYETRDSTSLETPDFADIVEFDYDIRTLSGETIYPEEELSPRTYRMDQEALFGGLREGLKIMREGETVTFLFPSHKAYGFYGDKDRIGRNVPIISTVTLNNITKVDNNQNEN